MRQGHREDGDTSIQLLVESPPRSANGLQFLAERLMPSDLLIGVFEQPEVSWGRSELMNSELKRCSTCGKIFPLDIEFYGQYPSGNFRARCRECNRKAGKEWAEANPDAVRAKWTRQNLKRSLAGPQWTQEDVAILRKKLGDKCAYCGSKLLGGGEVDHMISLEEGGTNALSNLTLSCMECNRAKGARSAEEFMKWRLSRGRRCQKQPGS